jgi:hypothetical protein
MFVRGKFLDEMQDWVSNARNQSFQRDKRIEALQGLLSRSPLADPDKALAGSHVGVLANWYLIHGTVRVADGQTAGWIDLLYGMVLDYWHVRLLVEQWTKDPRKNKQPRMDTLRPALCLAMAMAFQKQAIIAWLGKRLAHSVQDGAFGAWGTLQLPSLVLQLYQHSTGQNLRGGPTVGDPSGPYTDIFTQWDQSEPFAQALRRACDYHVEQSVDQGDEFIGEFSRYPFNIIPFEVYAIGSVRRQEGMTMPTITHPLLTAPFDDVPTDVPDPVDELLAQVALIS